SGDLYAHRGPPRDRFEQWKVHKAENPDANMREWLRDFDSGVGKRLAAEELSYQAQRSLRTDLLKGIPESQRRRFANASVEVLSDADFNRLTRGARGSAVTLIEGGKPRVLLREGADPRALREEGLHMLQSIDPRTRRAIRSLDESRLQHWDDLSIDEQMRLYRNKVDLEIDAQNRLLRSLDEELADAGGNRSGRSGLRAQRDIAQENLSNLQHRLGDVESITPRQRRNMARGLEIKPDYLLRPPRLFSKGGDLKIRSALYDALRTDLRVSKAKNTFKSLNERVKNNPKLSGINNLQDDILVSVERISRTDPRAASRYLDAVQEVLQASPRRANTRSVLPFLRIASKLDRPDVFLRNVRRFVSDPRIRGDMLEQFGNSIGKMTRRDASDFLIQLRKLTAVDPTNTKLLQKRINSLRMFARSRRSVRLGLVDDIVAELNRKSRFDWNVFRQKLGTKYANSSGFTELENILTSRRLNASWDAADIGAVRHWATALGKLHTSLPATQQVKLMQEVGDLLDGFTSGYSSGSYRKMRHLIRDRVADHIMTAPGGTARTGGARTSMLRSFLEIFQNIDSATKGALFTEFRQRLLRNRHKLSGDFSNVIVIPKAKLLLPNGKTADGAVTVGSNMGARKPKKGRYLVDDKAGADPFDLPQAQRYSDLLDANNLTTDTHPNRGLIYIFENNDAAKAAKILLDQNGLNGNIFVAVVDSGVGNLKILTRSTAP
ncbi:MAG: hypothetical protein QNK15_06755, partial [Cycloclasticus sp.]|nr:hypothetical protein [Cycloclasticus sp.]